MLACKLRGSTLRCRNLILLSHDVPLAQHDVPLPACAAGSTRRTLWRRSRCRCALMSGSGNAQLPAAARQQLQPAQLLAHTMNKARSSLCLVTELLAAGPVLKHKHSPVYSLTPAFISLSAAGKSHAAFMCMPRPPSWRFRSLDPWATRLLCLRQERLGGGPKPCLMAA